MAFLFGRIAESRESKGVRVIDTPGQFARVEVCFDLTLDRKSKRLGQVLVRAALRVERTKEPKLVFLDRSTDVKSGIDLRETVRCESRLREVLCRADKAVITDEC